MRDEDVHPPALKRRLQQPSVAAPAVEASTCSATTPQWGAGTTKEMLT